MEERLTCEEIMDRALIERYVAGELPELEAAVLESHFLTCAHCQTEVRLAQAIRDTLPEVAEAGARPPLEVSAVGERDSADAGEDALSVRRRAVGRQLKARTAVALAAAAVLAGLLFLRPSEIALDREPVHREEGTGEELALTVEAPVGEVAALEEFRWSPVASADLYRVAVYDPAGEVIWEVDTRETRIAPPDATEFEPGSLYLWKVDARVGWDRWVSSELVRFSISVR